MSLSTRPSGAQCGGYGSRSCLYTAFPIIFSLSFVVILGDFLSGWFWFSMCLLHLFGLLSDLNSQI